MAAMIEAIKLAVVLACCFAVEITILRIFSKLTEKLEPFKKLRIISLKFYQKLFRKPENEKQ